MRSYECTKDHAGEHGDCEGKFSLSQRRAPFYAVNVRCTCICHTKEKEKDNQ